MADGQDKCIGRLTLDISDVEKKIQDVNKFLSGIGANINLEDKLSKSISSALEKLVNEARKAGEDASKAIAAELSKANDVNIKDDNIKRAISLWKQYYDAMTRAQNAANNNNYNQVDYWLKEAMAIEETAKAIKEESAFTKELEKAKRMYNAAVEAGKDKQHAADLREQAKAQNELEQAMKAAAKAGDDYVKMWEKLLKDRDMQIDKEVAKAEAAEAKKVAAAEAAREKEVAAHERKEAAYNEMWHRAEAARDAQAAKEEAAIEREVAKAEEAAERRAQAEQDAQDKINAARAKQESDYQAVWDKASFEERQAAIKAYADAYADFYKQKTNMEKALTGSNAISQESEKYKQLEENIRKAQDAMDEAASHIRKDQQETAEATKQATDAVREYNTAVSARQDSDVHKQEEAILARAKQAYFDLTDAIKNYNAAKKEKDQFGMAAAEQQIAAQHQNVQEIYNTVQASQMEAGIKQQILNYIQQCATAEHQHAAAAQETTRTTSDLQGAVNGLVTRYLSLLAVIRMIKSVLGEMIDYVHQYSDKMNEIRIITGKTSEEAERLGETYRNLAESMSVSSLDMADAAIYFTRQGLGAAEIEERLKSTTMYAKTANIEFERAAELITAVVNSMNLVEEEADDGRAAAQRVADVFLKVGDNAATSGEEIGEAMQKAAASAGTFGVQFEWLAAYIATVSETTRQEARTIGTAFNTIIARLHQIKQQGYNSEDETKINDIAKALANVDIALMDQNGEWRDMTDILQDVASKWNDMDDKTRSYIATTMAGVKQQNVFLALMNDMAKGVDGGSRAWELYEKAMDSAGTAEEKYAVYTDSVTAAQERLTVAQEKFYSLLQDDVIKGWYEILTKIVTGITNATKATQGWNIYLPVLIGLVVTLGIALNNAAQKAATLGAAMKSFAASHPVLLGITAAASLIGIITAFNSEASDAEQEAAAAAARAEEIAKRFEKAKKHLDESTSRIKELRNLQGSDLFEDLRANTKSTDVIFEEYEDTLNELCAISPGVNTVVEQLRDGLINQKEAAEKLNEELEKAISNYQKISMANLWQMISNYTPSTMGEDEDSDTYKERIQALRNWQSMYPDALKSAESFKNTLKEISTLGGQYDSPLSFWSNELIGTATGSWNEMVDARRLLPSDIMDRINEMWGELANSTLNDDEKWDIIAQEAWYKLMFGSDTGEDLTEQLTREANNLISTVIDSIGANYQLNDVQKGYVTKLLRDAIFGDDEQLDFTEFLDMTSKVQGFVADIMAHGVQINPADMVQYMIGDIFDEDMVKAFTTQLSDLKNNPDVAKQISDAYTELLAAGFNQGQLKDLYWGMLLESGYSIEALADAIDAMRKKLKDKLDQTYKDDQGMSLIGLLFGDDYESLDLDTLKLLSDLSELGVAFEDIEDAVNRATSHEGMIKNLRELLNLKAETPKEKTWEDLIKELKATEKEIEAIDDALTKLRKGETIKFSDMMDLVEAHPEILGVMNDLGALEDMLEGFKYQRGTSIVNSIQDTIMNSEDVMKNSPFAQYYNDDVRTLADLSPEMYKALGVREYVAEAVATFLSASGQLSAVGDEWMESLIGSMFSDANMDLVHRKAIDAAELVKAGWEDAGEGIATVFSSTYTAGTTDKTGKKAPLQWNENVVISFTPILPDGTVLSPEASDAYIEKLLSESTNIEELKTADKEGNGGKGLIIDITAVADDESFADAEYRANNLLVILHQIHEYLFGDKGKEKSWLDEQVEAANQTAELEWAKSNSYVEQIGSLRRALTEGGADEAYDTWTRLDDKMKEAVASTYPDVAAAMLEIEKATNDTEASADDLAKAEKNLSTQLQKANKYATAKNFTSTYQAIQKLEKGTISATDAYETFNKELDNVVKAGEDIIDVEQKMADKTEITASDVSNLSKVLGISAEQILQDWPAAVAAFDDMTGAAGELQAVFDALNAAAFIKITGTSEADFSAIQNGLISTQNMAQETIDLLLATGQWTTDTIPLDAEAWVQGKDGKWTKKYLTGMQQILKPTGKNPYKGRGTGVNKDATSGKKGGGGGGGGSKDSDKNGMTEVERQLDRYSQRNAIQEYQQSYYSAQKGYYNQTGQLQGVIGYSQRELELLKEQNKTLEGNVRWIEEYMDKKSAELAQLSITDEKYEEVADDLDKLQKAHQEYTNQLIENKTSIDELTKAIDEQRKKIREMEINLRNTILKAIEDREKRTENMLNAEIEMENTILDLITKRYERERDKIIENTNLKIDSLNKEKEALDEQLRIRREQEEAEDKQLKLRELEAKYQRIIADPTRMKEAKSIKQEIDDLRKEMAWDLAEEEVKAQQDSIDQQIESLDDYIEYVQNYYEDLFEHPQKLIEEMKNIMLMTDQEIIDWLIANDEEFDKSTENTQLKMIEGWQETLDTMHDIIKTHWDEVEYIIEQGEDYIINFLKENSEDYRQAGKLQADAYVDEWMEQLENLRKAHEAVQTQMASTYSVIEKADSSSSSSKSGGSGKNGGSNNNDDTTNAKTSSATHGYAIWINGKKYKNQGYASEDAAANAAQALISSYFNGARMSSSEIDALKREAAKTLTTYKIGGLATTTGPAWLDGSPQLPERVLNPYQTQLFETMVEALERMSRLSIPGMPYFGDMSTSGGNPVSVGDIIVNVENLDTDDDYEELADKVSEVLMDRIGKTSAIGGLRIRSI